ncbi:MAG: B12-binding domain-containing radical SAM protein [Bacillus sp. (in: Bacteria)]|nr:B12-binding domain-containing radical SAM protein [Bacillus sp. (in: firmicutes)]MCM1427438.1 B12-binding domain-containing radical SAM protein [Eubacterium sp.]
MKILLTAVNAKYIHSNPAVYSLRAYAGKSLMPYIEVAEYTINHRKEEILADIYRRKPDVIAFSCYIWNWDMISGLLAELPKILPETDIWLGGPEVSYYPEKLLEKYPMTTGIMIGEGEETFRELAESYRVAAASGIKASDIEFEKIRGLVYRAKVKTKGMPDTGIKTKGTPETEIRHTPARELTDISAIPFLYEDLTPFENKIIYYESSRGCPYRCSYCLSSIDKKVRLRNPDIVKKELQFFLEHRVKQVKFVDRTFNCTHEHAKEIWKYLAEHDNGITNFHFEIAADIISEEELEILAKMRPGLMQMEIGVQTFNPRTLQEIRRTTNMDRLKEVVERIQSGGNIHIHLDLIAGLPYEDYGSFIHSFNSVYDMKPQQLQLGFLKVLKGSYLYEKAADYGIRYMDTPPYEALSTKWISYEELLLLKQVEEMVEVYYNSGQFAYTMPVIQTVFPDAFTMYLRLADFYRENGYALMTPARIYRYQVLFDFAMTTKLAGQKELLCQLLTFDLYLRENSKSRPDFAKELTPYKEKIRNFYKEEEENRHYLPSYADYDSRQLGKMTHMEVFDYPVWETDIAKRMNKQDAPAMVLFDYQSRNALTYEAKYTVVG